MIVALIANTMQQAHQELDYFYRENRDNVRNRFGTVIWFKDGTTLFAYSRDTIHPNNQGIDQVFLVDNIQYNDNLRNALAQISARSTVPDGFIINTLEEYRT